MKRLLFVVFGSLLAALPVEAGAAGSSCEPKVLARLQLEVSPGGAVYMPATLGDHEVYFELSIGSGLPLIFESAATALGIEPKPWAGYGEMSFGGKRVTQFVKLEKMKVGDFSLLARAAPLIPQSGAEPPNLLNGKPIVGVMGSTLIQRVDAELNLAERQLILFQPFKCRSQSPVYWGAEAAVLPMGFDPAGALVLTLELDGKRVQTSLLNGDRVSTIDVNATREFFGFDETSPGVEIVADGDGSRAQFHAMSITGRGLGIEGTKVRLRKGSSCKLTGRTPVYGAIGYETCINRVPFNLGIDLLSQLRLYIASSRRTVYVSKVASPEGTAGEITVKPAR
jgi:hypothetical protein